jgi:integrase
MADRSLLDERVRLYKRKGSPYWQSAAFLGSKNWRKSTHETDATRAKDVAEDWYWMLREKLAAGQIKPLHRFREAAALFVDEYKILTRGQRNEEYANSHASRIARYLNPFFGSMPLTDIKTGTIVSFRVWRQRLALSKHGKPAARTTIQHDIVTLRLVMKLAELKGWIDRLPNFAEPYRPSTKVSHRAWFSAREYFELCRATWARANSPRSGERPETCRQLHDYVVFMANTGLRPDEAARLEFRDITVDEEEWIKPILVLDVRGKRGTGYCKSMPGAVRAYRRLLARTRLGGDGKPFPTDKLFPLDHRDLFNRILRELDLKTDRDGLRPHAER